VDLAGIGDSRKKSYPSRRYNRRGRFAGCRRRAIVNRESIADGPARSFAGDFEASLGRADSSLAQKRACGRDPRAAIVFCG